MNYKSFIFVAFVNVLGLLPVGDGSGILGLGLLSPLLPVATITGHAGLMAHGLTGAALLKLKAAGLLSGLFLLSGRGIELNLGNNEEANGWGWGWDDGRRKKRSTEDISRQDVQDPSLDDVLAFDQIGCGMRLVCELSATPYTHLMEDERVIFELFGRDGKVPMPSKASKAKLTYSYASILGSTAKDGPAACGRIYATCPYSRIQIMSQLRQAQV